MFDCYVLGPLVEVWSQLNEAGILAPTLQKVNAFTYDVVDVGRQVISNLFYDLYAVMVSAYDRKDSVAFTATSHLMLEMISDWDTLLSSHESYLLGRWIADARAWAGECAVCRVVCVDLCVLCVHNKYVCVSVWW